MFYAFLGHKMIDFTFKSFSGLNFKIKGKTNFIPETKIEKFLSVNKELTKEEKKETTDKNEEISKNEIKEDKFLEQKKNNL